MNKFRFTISVNKNRKDKNKLKAKRSSVEPSNALKVCLTSRLLFESKMSLENC